MKSRSDTLNRELSSLDPVRPEEMDQARCDAAAEALLYSILSAELEPREDSVSPAKGPSKGRLRSKRTLAAVVGVAMVAALTLAVGLPNGINGNHDAMAALDEVAGTAASQPIQSTQLPYLYLKTQSRTIDTSVAHGKAWSVYRSEIREEWAAGDGSGRRRVTEEPPQFVGPADRAAWEAAGKPNFLPANGGHTAEESLPAGSLEDGVGGEELSALPTEPTALSQSLRQRAEDIHSSVPIPARTLELIGEMLRNPVATPELRAALYKAAAMVPGIEYLGERTDVTGRKGLAVGVVSTYSGGPTLYSLIYDPRNSKALAMEATVLEPVAFADTPAPFVISATIYLASGRTESLSRP